jgi:outer membrane protein TolC
MKQGWAVGVLLGLSWTVLHAEESPARPAPILTLEQCYREAMGRNPMIQRARQGLETAAGQQVVLQSRTFPKINGGADAGQRGERGDDDAQWFVIVRGSLAQPLVDASILPAWARGRIGVLMAAQRLNVEVVQALHQVRVAFLRSLYSRSLLEMYQGQQALLANNRKRQQERLDVGTVGKRQVLQAEVQFENFAPRLAEVRRDYLVAATDLTRLLGRDLGVRPGQKKEDALVVPDGELRRVAAAFAVEEQSVRVRQRRPDLVLLRQTIDAAEKEKEMAEAGYFPRISLVSDVEYLPIESLDDHDTINQQPGDTRRNSVWRYGGAFSWRVIDTGHVLGASRRIEATREGYQEALKELEENVPRDLIRVQRSLRLADAKWKGLQENVRYAEENVKLVESNLALSQATQLDFQDAQTNLLTTRSGVLEALFQQELARAEYDRVTGRYLDLAAVNALAVDKAGGKP